MNHNFFLKNLLFTAYAVLYKTVIIKKKILKQSV